MRGEVSKMVRREKKEMIETLITALSNNTSKKIEQLNEPITIFIHLGLLKDVHL